MLDKDQIEKAEAELNNERREKVLKLRANIHEFILLEGKSFSMMPEDITLALVLEAAASTCACSAMRGNPDIAVYLLNVYEEKVSKYMIKYIAEVLAKESASDKVH